MEEKNLSFSEDLQELTIANGYYSGTYKAVKNESCAGCDFRSPSDGLFAGLCVDLPATFKCTGTYNPRNSSVIWVKNTDVPKPTPRPHADLISKWISNANLKVWQWHWNGCWSIDRLPSWDKNIIYAVSLEKPTYTPTKEYKFTIIGKEYKITLDANLSKEEVDAKIKERVLEITEFSWREV